MMLIVVYQKRRKITENPVCAAECDSTTVPFPEVGRRLQE
jgi:hypothetical protein